MRRGRLAGRRADEWAGGLDLQGCMYKRKFAKNGWSDFAPPFSMRRNA